MHGGGKAGRAERRRQAKKKQRRVIGLICASPVCVSRACSPESCVCSLSAPRSSLIAGWWGVLWAVDVVRFASSPSDAPAHLAPVCPGMRGRVRCVVSASSKEMQRLQRGCRTARMVSTKKQQHAPESNQRRRLMLFACSFDSGHSSAHSFTSHATSIDTTI